MLFIIIPVIIGFILGLLDSEEIGIALCSGFLGLAIGTMLYLFIGGMLGTSLPTVDVVEEQKICALVDSSEIEGANYLFSGYIGEKLVFRYVINTDKGKHIEEIQSVENVYINEGDYEPMVKIYSKEFAKEWYNWIAFPWFSKEYVFYVPHDTITNEYNIDLQ